MPQKRSGFQSKPRFGGQKPGGSKKFGDKGRGRSGGGGFDKRSEGDRSDRPERSERSERPERRERTEWKGGGERDSRPRGDKPFGDRPFKKKSFGDKKFGDRDDRKGGFGGGDRPFKKKFEARGDRGADRGGDKPFTKRPFRDNDRDAGAQGGDRPFKKRSFGDKKFGDKKFGDRDDRKGGFSGGGDRPFKKRPFNDKGERGGDRPFKKSFGDRKPEGRPERSFDDGKKFGDKKFDDNKKFDRPKKSYTRYEDRPQSFDRQDVSQKLKSDRAQYGAPSSAFLYGAHAVRAALLNPKRLHQRLLCTQRGYDLVSEAWQEAANAGLKVPQPQYVEKEDIERLLPREAVHQDILLDCQPLEETFLADLLVSAGDNAKILVLDQVTDPHNVGAILRSAAAFGATAVVAQRLHSPDITGIIAKAASGAVEYVPFVREVNLSRALEQLKEAGFFCIGLAEEGKRTLSDLKLSGKVALVLGAEGEGLRRLVAENCDELVKLPTQGPISSLNVSNAAAVAMYELVK